MPGGGGGCAFSVGGGGGGACCSLGGGGCEGILGEGCWCGWGFGPFEGSGGFGGLT